MDGICNRIDHQFHKQSSSNNIEKIDNEVKSENGLNFETQIKEITKSNLIDDQVFSSPKCNAQTLRLNNLLV